MSAKSKCITCGASYDPVASIGRLECVFHPGHVKERQMPVVAAMAFSRGDASSAVRIGHYTCCGLSQDRKDQLHFDERALPGCVNVDHCSSREELDSVRALIYHPVPHGVLNHERATRLALRGLLLDVSTKKALVTHIRAEPYPGYGGGNTKTFIVNPMNHYETLRANILKDSAGAVLPLRRLLADSYAVSMTLAKKGLRSNSPFYPLYSSQLRMTASGSIEMASSVISAQKNATSLMSRSSSRASEAEAAKKHVDYWKGSQKQKRQEDEEDDKSSSDEDLPSEDDDGEDDGDVPDELRADKNVVDVDPEKGREFGASSNDSRLYYEGEEAMNEERLDEIEAAMDMAERGVNSKHAQKLGQAAGDASNSHALAEKIKREKRIELLHNFVPFHLIRRVGTTIRHECAYVVANKQAECS